MATIPLWLRWRDAQPEAADWARLLDRARQRSRYAGRELSGPGYRIFVARTRGPLPATDDALLLNPGQGSYAAR